MYSRAGVAPAIDRMSGAFEPKSSSQSQTKHSQAAASIACPAVLLVGRNGSWGSFVLRSLEKLGCNLSHEVPQALMANCAGKCGYDLILLDSSVPQELRRQLTSELVGSETSVFYTFPVENGCWWLPALRRGQDCHGAPAFRRNEFPLELERILKGETES